MHQLGWCMTNFNQGYQIKIIPKETKRTLLLLLYWWDAMEFWV